MYNRNLNISKLDHLILLGPRQTGKSTFLKNFLKGKKHLIFDLLLSDLFRKYEKNPEQFLSDVEFQIKHEQIEYILVDEIQKIPALLDLIHVLIEKKYSCHFFLSGSSARKLKIQHANMLGGRAILKKMFPFVYSELNDHFKLEEVLQYGTICSIINSSKEEKILKLKSYLDAYIKDEILSEGLLRKLPPFYRFIDLIGQLAGEIVNYSNIARESHTSEHTIKNYFQILEETAVGFFLPAYDVSIKRSMSLHPKFYLFDNGLTNAIAQRLNDSLSPEIKGKLFEQWIINEIRAHLSYNTLEYSIYYWRTKNGHEVDLLLTRSNIPLYGIEIKFKTSLRKSDFNSLLKLKDDYNDIKLFLISNITHPYEENGIIIVPWKYFLEKTILSILPPQGQKQCSDE